MDYVIDFTQGRGDYLEISNKNEFVEKIQNLDRKFLYEA
jgi:uncharacterized protein YbcV (DUF1398 family)